MRDYDIASRKGLPDALRVLFEQYPREFWESHDNFSDLTRFWLDRHLMFRKALGMMQTEARDFLDHETEARHLANQTARIGSFFLQNLHGHHQIEDQHYFPRLIGMEPRLDRGFEMLDADHHALDGHLHALAETANQLIRSTQESGDVRAGAGEFLDCLAQMETFLNRHLTDEEDLIVPIILRHGDPGH